MKKPMRCFLVSKSEQGEVLTAVTQSELPELAVGEVELEVMYSSLRAVSASVFTDTHTPRRG